MIESFPRIGVLVPSYNHSDFIVERIESILNQTFNDFSIYVVDDCSSDGTWDLLQTYAFHPRVTLRRSKSPSGSPFSHYLEYFKNYRHDYWWIAESDDFADKEFLGRLWTILESNPGLSFAYTSSITIDAAGNRLGTSRTFLERYFPELNWTTSFEIPIETGLNLLTRGQMVPNMSSLVIRSSALDFRKLRVIKRFKLAGDWFFVILIQAKGKGFFLSENLNYFRSHENTARIRTDMKPKAAEYLICNYFAWRNSKSRRSIVIALQDTLTMAKSDHVSISELIRELMKISKIFLVQMLMSFSFAIKSDPAYLLGKIRRYLFTDKKS